MNNLIIRDIEAKDLLDVATIQVTGWQNTYQDFIDYNYLKREKVIHREAR